MQRVFITATTSAALMFSAAPVEAAPAATTKKPYVAKHRGCNTKACDRRVSKKLAIKKRYSWCNTWKCVRRMDKRRPPITPLMSCIIKHESGGNPLAQNGQYKGIAQWSPEAWSRHGGLKYGPTPHHATYWEQVRVLANGLRLYGCRDWCPFDGC